MTNAEITLAIISAILGSSFLTTLLNLIAEKLNKNSAKKQALRLILIDNILTKGPQYVANGFIGQTEWKIYDEQYKTYKRLGGDGYADKMYAAVNELVPEEIKGISNTKK